MSNTTKVTSQNFGPQAYTSNITKVLFRASQNPSAIGLGVPKFLLVLGGVVLTIKFTNMQKFTVVVKFVQSGNVYCYELYLPNRQSAFMWAVYRYHYHHRYTQAHFFII